MEAIITRGKVYGSLAGVATKNTEIQSRVNKSLKEGKAVKKIDTDEILMYTIKD